MMQTMKLPEPTTANPVTLRGDYAAAGADYVVQQAWSSYTAEEHARWAVLQDRQFALARRYGAPQFLTGLMALGLAFDRQIPRFEVASEVLRRATGWEIVAVPGLIPDDVFFEHLAGRRFPVTVWLRTPTEMDYLVEPDVFHDFFGHVPLLCDPVFADFVQAYGVAGRKAAAEGGVAMLSRLYWYSVEFGLIETADGLRTYGAGILSSASETQYSMESLWPHRLRFDVERVMRTAYAIDTFQKTYFVVRSFEELFRESYERDFAPLYRRYRDMPPYSPTALLPTDEVVILGTR
jgi:phenylalanine-4-hydroxylase